MLQGVPELRVIVSGRGRVDLFEELGKSARFLALTGMTDPEVKEWLQERGIREGRVIRQVIKLARGIPLIVQLAFKLLRDGGSLDYTSFEAEG